MSLQKHRKFNWDGIYDNGDGTYSAVDKRARTRLLKEFHHQGFTVRSVKAKEGGGWTVSTVGTTNKRMGSPPVFRGNNPTRRMMPGQRRMIRPRMGMYPPRYHNYGAPPRGRGLGLGRHIVPYIARKIREAPIKRQIEQDRRVAAKKTEHEINEKQKEERIQQERQETIRQIRKQELERERLQHEKHQEAERMRSRLGVHITKEGGQVATREEVPAKREEPKTSSATLQEARSDYVTGE